MARVRRWSEQEKAGLELTWTVLMCVGAAWRRGRGHASRARGECGLELSCVRAGWSREGESVSASDVSV